MTTHTTTETIDTTTARRPGDGRGLCLTDSGLETTIIFTNGLELPHFAAFTLLDTPAGRDALDAYVESHLAVARREGLPIAVDTPTWRASTDWGALLGHDEASLARINADAVRAVAAHRTADTSLIVSGAVGPRGDGYVVGREMTVGQARDYHTPQVRALADAGADLVTAMTMTHPAEAGGVALAARDAGIPVVISFTVEVDGRLPSGHTLGDAIRTVDELSDGAVLHHMVNCAHPTHVLPGLEPGASWLARIKGVRANASRMSHEELDAATELDRGDIADLVQGYQQMADVLPDLQVVGGCCGTDHTHVAALARALQTR